VQLAFLHRTLSEANEHLPRRVCTVTPAVIHLPSNLNIYSNLFSYNQRCFKRRLKAQSVKKFLEKIYYLIEWLLLVAKSQAALFLHD